MNDKEKMFSIGETARSIGITRRIILNYEARGLVSPDIKEGVSGNRYYTIDTLTKVRTIRILQKLGLSLDEIRRYLEGTTDLIPLINRLETMRDELNLNIEKLYERAGRDRHRIKEIVLNPQTVYRRTANSRTISDKTEFLRDTAIEAMRMYGTDTTKRMYFTEHPLDDPKTVSYCVAIPAESCGEFVVTLPKTKAICIYHHGAYEEIPCVCKKLVEYAKKNGKTSLGVCRHIYIEGAPQHKDKSKYITQVVLPVGGE